MKEKDHLGNLHYDITKDQSIKSETNKNNVSVELTNEA